MPSSGPPEPVPGRRLGPQLVVSDEPHGQVWQVGFKPDPWVWADWKWAQGGRFNGRWDDSAGMFRTLYVANSLLGCLLEVLASLRPDPTVVAEMSEIVEDEEDANAYPTVSAGEIDPTWLERRTAGSAVLRGRYCAVTETESVAALRTRFLRLALSLGREDFDAAANRPFRQVFTFQHAGAGSVPILRPPEPAPRVRAAFRRTDACPLSSPLLRTVFDASNASAHP
ncbi:MAG: RES domain-containing protein [Actinomycetota bacterium]|nr:RES domain-containing protein [Actinomycetota bacterium]